MAGSPRGGLSSGLRLTGVGQDSREFWEREGELVSLKESEEQQKFSSEAFETYRRALATFAEATRTPTLAVAPDLPQRLICSGHVVGLVAVVPFCSGEGGGVWQRKLKTAPLAAQASLAPYALTIERDGVKGTFSHVEAAYQALRWWHDEKAREGFSMAATGRQCARLMTQCQAKENKEGLVRPKPWDPREQGEALLTALRARCEIPGQDVRLLATSGALLLCSTPLGYDWEEDQWTNPTLSTSAFSAHWTQRGNAYGWALMLVREELARARGMPPSWPQGVRLDNWELTVAEARGFCAAQVLSWKD
eukprot:Hpha_TRINITY_DN23215_c0_g1::TRINITY_DN23215_c0_g1_i1::g.30150::m.30150